MDTLAVEHHLPLRSMPCMIAPEQMLLRTPEQPVPRWLMLDDPWGNGTSYFAFAGMAPEHTRAREPMGGLIQGTLTPDAAKVAADGLLPISEARPVVGTDPNAHIVYEDLTKHIDRVTAAQFYTYPMPVGTNRLRVIRNERMGYTLHWLRVLLNATGAAASDLRAITGAIASVAEEEEDGWVGECVMWAKRTGMYSRVVRDMKLHRNIREQSRKTAALTVGAVLSEDLANVRPFPNWRTMMCEARTGEDLRDSYATGLPYANSWQSKDIDIVAAGMTRALEVWFDRWYAEHMLVLATGGRRAFPVDPILHRRIPVSHPLWHDPEFQRIRMRGTRNRRRMVR